MSDGKKLSMDIGRYADDERRNLAESLREYARDVEAAHADDPRVSLSRANMLKELAQEVDPRDKQ